MPRAFCFALLLLIQGGVALGADPTRWLLIDTADLSLTVYDGPRPQLTLHNLSIGRYGTNTTKRRGDNTTPLGRFHIVKLVRDGAFHHYIGLDYPDMARARRGHRSGLISHAQYRAIAAAHRHGTTPPQDTALGGHIGIHGLGRAMPGIHAAMNWTRGCIALTDEQMDTLLTWVRIGMLVKVR